MNRETEIKIKTVEDIYQIVLSQEWIPHPLNDSEKTIREMIGYNDALATIKTEIAEYMLKVKKESEDEHKRY